MTIDKEKVYKITKYAYAYTLIHEVWICLDIHISDLTYTESFSLSTIGPLVPQLGSNSKNLESFLPYEHKS